MAKIGRNSPCPCGSGKKYKRCCLGHGDMSFGGSIIFDDDEPLDELDRISNHANDLIKSGKLDEAEIICNRLIEKYPDQIDGIMRLVDIYEARGDYSKAAEYAIRTATFMRNTFGFDTEQIVHYKRKAEALKERAAEQTHSPDGRCHDSC